MNTIENLKRIGSKIIIALLDIIIIFCSFFAALWIRFEFRFDEIPKEYFDTFLKTIGFWAVFSVIIFIIFKLYKGIYGFISVNDLTHIVWAYAVLCILGVAAKIVFTVNMPRSYFVIGFILSFFGTCAIRLAYRFFSNFKTTLENNIGSAEKKRIMIIGAGNSGRMLINEFENANSLEGKVMCLIDDDPMKKGCILEGVSVVGDRYFIPTAVAKYKINQIIFAIPTAVGKNRKDILDICSKTGCDVKVVPGIYQLINGQTPVSKLRKVNVQDLLGREPIKVDDEEIFKFLKGKTVLVTGGGGSIGSELCRQIAKSEPGALIVFDIYENNAYQLQMELTRTYPSLNLIVLIGSVRNTSRLEYIFGKYRPQLVFHAAAHKHVPLMEDSPNEAIKNNVFGTYKTAMAAAKYGVEKFVLISTDKAVNPTNIMGASKRLCEMVIQMMGRRNYGTDFVAVRFGNVLGSNGSVIPLFESQIEKGGPVTVTHPDITRYFMTIPEAVALVLQAGCYAHGGKIFVLDMGEPVKIDNMARNLIRLSGYEPDVDIKVVYTGLRPGEKLYEELLMKEEGLQATKNKLIYIGSPIEMDDDAFLEKLKELKIACNSESESIKDIVASVVTTYKKEN